MPTPSTRPFQPSFESQISIESLIAAPLIAASKANVVMITGQTRALLENCFDKRDDKTYEPVMINMTLTKSFVQKVKTNPQDKNSEEIESIQATKMVFAMPLLCLIPINNLVVDKINVDFDLEITSVTHKQATSGLAGGDPIIDKKATLNGKVSTRSGESGSKTDDNASRLKVNINAGPLPLPLGLLTVLELYTKSILPVSPEKT